jgi:stress response protein YsnF
MGTVQDEQGSDEAHVLPVAQETMHVSKHDISMGRVKVGTRTESVSAIAEADLRVDEAEVVRVPMGQTIEQAPQVRMEGDVTIVPVIAEELVVETRLVLVEEIHIRRKTRTERVEAPVTLRKQRVVVERVPPENSQNED